MLDELVSDFIKGNPETIEVRDSLYQESGHVSTVGFSCFDPSWPSKPEMIIFSEASPSNLKILSLNMQF